MRGARPSSPGATGRRDAEPAPEALGHAEKLPMSPVKPSGSGPLCGGCTSVTSAPAAWKAAHMRIVCMLLLARLGIFASER